MSQSNTATVPPKRQQFDDYHVSRAAYFTAVRFRGRGVYERQERPTLSEAIMAGREIGRAMIYAVTPEDWSIHICNAGAPGMEDIYFVMEVQSDPKAAPDFWKYAAGRATLEEIEARLKEHQRYSKRVAARVIGQPSRAIVLSYDPKEGIKRHA